MRAKWIISSTFLFYWLVFVAPISAITTSDYAVLASAEVKTNPPSIILKWTADPDATNYTIFKKSLNEQAWTQLAILSGNATFFADTNVTIGSAYEYRISKAGLEGTTYYTGEGYLYSGIELPLVENWGTVLLIVETNVATSLSNELERLKLDLVGDGWEVLTFNVSRNDSVLSVKSIITNAYYSYPNVKAVFLLGSIPVPYSGYIAPDGHSDHIGAWPADVFYADVDGLWTDISVNVTNTSQPRLTNIPGDGKFDQSSIPSDVELWIGRVDLHNMPAFPLTETELIRQYLNKNHNFRFRYITTVERGLIDDNFGTFSGEAFAASAYRDFSAMFGSSNIFVRDYFTTLSTNSYLWSYANGAGSYTSANGVGSTYNFVTNDVMTIFTMLFGSYHGDWDSQNNFMRAALCSATYTLSCAWSGRPHWHFHHTALGMPIGFSAFITQNNNTIYSDTSYFKRYVHIALMGDPTLRTRVVAPPSALRCEKTIGGVVNFYWRPSTDSVLGYKIYGATNLYGPYFSLYPAVYKGTNFSFSTLLQDVRYLMVKAVKLEQTASGTYYNTSQGILQSIGNNLPVTVAIDKPVSGTRFTAPALVKITVSAFDPPNSISAVEFYQGNYKLGEDNTPPFEIAWSNAPAGVYQITVRAILSDSSAITSAPVTIQIEDVLIEKQSFWAYLDNGSNQGTAWRLPNFDDSGWKVGQAELGYSNAPITVIDFGPDPANKYITTYFRKKFYIRDPSIYTNLVLGLKRDDGAVVYINGIEVLRSNMPTNTTITYLTLASSAVGGADESTFFVFNIQPNRLVAGTNVIAVEVHQNSPSSSDLSFDLYLYAYGAPPPFKLDVAQVEPNNLRVTYPALTPLITVETKTNLFPGSWVNLTNNVLNTNGFNYVILPAIDQIRFFRLKLN